MSWTEIRQLISRKLQRETNITVPYKLCDFRPAYGLIFSDLIREYDFWGFGDIDVIYGNIRKFMTEDLLSRHDFISVRDDYVTGFFSLVRNNEKMNTFFTKSKDYVKVFSGSEYYRFDECPYSLYWLLDRKVSIYDVKWEIESLCYLVMKYNDEKFIRAHFDFIVAEWMPGKMVWNNGTLTYRDQYELLLYHLIDFKKKNRPQNIIYENIPPVYYIDRDQIRFENRQKGE
jgi:hypothetical protein